MNEADKVCNIYDLAGNYSEWIAETTNGGYPAICRGRVHLWCSVRFQVRREHLDMVSLTDIIHFD